MLCCGWQRYSSAGGEWCERTLPCCSSAAFDDNSVIAVQFLFWMHWQQRWLVGSNRVFLRCTALGNDLADQFTQEFHTPIHETFNFFNKRMLVRPIAIMVVVLVVVWVALVVQLPVVVLLLLLFSWLLLGSTQYFACDLCPWFNNIIPCFDIISLAASYQTICHRLHHIDRIPYAIGFPPGHHVDRITKQLETSLFMVQHSGRDGTTIQTNSHLNISRIWTKGHFQCLEMAGVVAQQNCRSLVACWCSTNIS